MSVSDILIFHSTLSSKHTEPNISRRLSTKQQDDFNRRFLLLPPSRRGKFSSNLQSSLNSSHPTDSHSSLSRPPSQVLLVNICTRKSTSQHGARSASSTPKSSLLSESSSRYSSSYLSWPHSSTGQSTSSSSSSLWSPLACSPTSLALCTVEASGTGMALRARRRAQSSRQIWPFASWLAFSSWLPLF